MIISIPDSKVSSILRTLENLNDDLIRESKDVAASGITSNIQENQKKMDVVDMLENKIGAKLKKAYDFRKGREM